MDVSVAVGQPGSAVPEVSIIVPARNEEASLQRCLQSLTSQEGVLFEVIVVDDGSTDRTREIAESFHGVRVIVPGPLPYGWTGKNNAVVAGAAIAQGEWLLFTDADTVHSPGALARALTEARQNAADMLSYSPEQIAVTFWEMAVLPVVFAELASTYPPKLVSDPASPVAAANGQYILIRRQAYKAVGGHQAIAGSLLEDVALAQALKKSGRKIRFRYAADAVCTRMYRNFRHLREGWTKNLALLFPEPGWLAAKSLLRWGVVWALFLSPMLAAVGAGLTGRIEWLAWTHDSFLTLAAFSTRWRFVFLGVGGFVLITRRLRRANFTSDRELLGAAFGYPMFAYLLLRSRRAHAKGAVLWKDREYKDRAYSDTKRQSSLAPDH